MNDQYSPNNKYIYKIPEFICLLVKYANYVIFAKDFFFYKNIKWCMIVIRSIKWFEIELGCRLYTYTTGKCLYLINWTFATSLNEQFFQFLRFFTIINMRIYKGLIFMSWANKKDQQWSAKLCKFCNCDLCEIDTAPKIWCNEG